MSRALSWVTTKGTRTSTDTERGFPYLRITEGASNVFVGLREAVFAVKYAKKSGEPNGCAGVLERCSHSPPPAIANASMQLLFFSSVSC